MNIKGFLALSVLLLTAAVASARTYTQNISSCTSSLTITNAQHQMGGYQFGADVYDGSTRVSTANASWSVNSSTYAISLSFSPSICSGSVVLKGLFAADTTYSTDFQVTVSGAEMTVCGSCASNSGGFARRTNTDTGTEAYVMTKAYTVSVSAPNGYGVAVHAYIQAGVLTFGINSSMASVSCSGGSDCVIAYGVSMYPFGAIPLGQGSFINGSFNSVTDNRPNWM